MLALNSQMCATSVTLSYFHVHTAINILRCFGYPREHNFGIVLILSPTGCTEGCVHFPQSCRNTHLPHVLDCLLNTTLIPCLLVFFLSILHERVCDYSRVQSSVTGMLRMGDMNIHITWLTHVRTGPKKKIAPRVSSECPAKNLRCRTRLTSLERQDAMRDSKSPYVGSPIPLVSVINS